MARERTSTREGNRMTDQVVAVAAAIAAADFEWFRSWDDLSVFDREHYRRLARAAMSIDHPKPNPEDGEV